VITSEDRKSKIGSIVRACRLISKMNPARPELQKSEALYYELLASYYKRLLGAQEKGDFIAAHTVFFPTEILYAMDIVPMHTETTTWTMALFLGDQAELLAAGAELGLVPEICSPHRGLAGAFHIKALPRPNVMLWSNLICDNTAKSGELVMKLNDCPGFFLDRPFQKTKDEMDYLVGEIKEMINFLEQQSGKKMNWDRLSEIVARMDEHIKLLQEINELRKAVPAPFPFQGYLKLLTVDYLFPGQPEATEYLKTLRDELADMVKNGKGAVPNERFRIMTLFVPPMYLMGFLEKIFQEYGTVSVVEPLFTLWLEGGLDPSHPLESVAKKSFLIPESRSMYGPLTQQALDEIVQSAKDYKVDGAIYWAFIGCRHTCATIKVVKDILNEIDVPMLTIDCDLVDPTINPKEEIREKLERFFEFLEER
jgi:benzoyl-CoA reductase/2-hydroxyglutaryl-CoA dehydratase subunit BcrC/BadD/HgdB